MAEKNYALISNGIVKNVVIFDDPSIELLDFFKELEKVDSIVPVEDKAYVNGEYDGVNFWPIKPHPSWVKNLEIMDWVAPLPYPEDGKLYTWNESLLLWEEDKQ